MLYANHYIWYIFVSALDIFLTYLILHPIFSSPSTAMLDAPPPTEPRGREVNFLANWIIQLAGVPGMVVYKFALVAIVITICEIIGRKRFLTGRRVVEWAIALSCVPVALALYQMARDLWGR